MQISKIEILKSHIENVTALFSNKSFLKYFYNTGWLLIDKILRLLLGLFVGAWVARYLGAEKYGIFSFVLSFIAIFAPIASLGLDNILVRELVNNKKKKNILLGTALSLKLAGALLFLMFITTALWLIENDKYSERLILIAAISIIFQSFNVIDNFFQSKVKSKIIVKANISSILLSNLIKIILIIFNAPLIFFIYTFLFDSFYIALSYLFVYQQNQSSFFKWNFNKKIAISLLKESWPLILTGLATSLAMRIDQVMLKYFVGLEELGQYSVGVKLAEVFVFLPIIISQSLFPKITTLDFLKERKKIINLFRYVFYALCILAIIISSLSKFAVTLLFGLEYEFSYKIVQILIWTIPITYIGIITNKLLIVEGKMKIIFYKQLILSVMNITLNFILIPRIGIIGAAIATLTTDLIINFFLDLLYKKTYWIFKLKMESFFFLSK